MRRRAASRVRFAAPAVASAARLGALAVVTMRPTTFAPRCAVPSSRRGSLSSTSAPRTSSAVARRRAASRVRFAAPAVASTVRPGALAVVTMRPTTFAPRCAVPSSRRGSLSSTSAPGTSNAAARRRAATRARSAAMTGASQKAPAIPRRRPATPPCRATSPAPLGWPAATKRASATRDAARPTPERPPAAPAARRASRTRCRPASPAAPTFPTSAASTARRARRRRAAHAPDLKAFEDDPPDGSPRLSSGRSRERGQPRGIMFTSTAFSQGSDRVRREHLASNGIVSTTKKIHSGGGHGFLLVSMKRPTV